MRARAATAVAVVALGVAAPANAGTINVTNNSDSGSGSLRQAVSDANPGDTIHVPAGTYVLTSGEITIDKKLEVDGAGASSTVISGNDASQIFSLTGALGVKIAGMTLTHAANVAPMGITRGGAISANSTSSLTLAGDTLSGNLSDASGGDGQVGGIAYGGGVYSDGPLVVRDSTFDHNRTVSNGGTGTGGTGGNTSGGGIYASRSLSVDNSTFSFNALQANGTGTGNGGGLAQGAGLFFLPGSGNPPTSISKSRFTGNTAVASAEDSSGGTVEGGGVLVYGSDTSISDSTFIDQSLTATGGASGGGGEVYGGGIYVDTGALTLTGSDLSHNSLVARGGGGIGGGARGAGAYVKVNSPKANSVRDSTFDRNSLDAAGGLNYSGGNAVGAGLHATGTASLEVSGSTFSAGTGLARSSGTGTGGTARGIGLFSDELATLTNITVSGNSGDASATGSGNGGDARGAGLYTAGESTAVNATIADNTVAATGTGGLAHGGNVSIGDPLHVKNTIVSGGDGAVGFENCDQSLGSEGHNIDSKDQCAFHATGDQVDKDPLLAALANNGGPTQTRRLLPGSLAIDHGDSAGAPDTDQRGIPRPQGSAFDVGAYEYDPADVAVNVAAPKKRGLGATLDYKVTVSNAGPSDAFGVVVHDALPGRLQVASVKPPSGSCATAQVVDCAIGTVPKGQTRVVHVVTTALAAGSVKNTVSVAGAFDDVHLADNSASATTKVTHVSPSKVKVKPRTFRLGTKLPLLLKGLKRVTRISFLLNGPARVTLKFQRRTKKHGKPRFKTAGRIRVNGDTGKNVVRFSGRLSKKKRLRPGRYRVAVTAVDRSGHRSKARKASFRLKRA
jgi:uncharacterized repeat protein (TIGR01451 family)